jgi:multidrug resistance efflux pump
MHNLGRYWKRALVGLGGAGVLLVIALAAVNGAATVPRASDREIAARTEGGRGRDLMSSRPSGSFASGLGIIEPLEPESRISATAAGRIAEILVREGERVEAGAILVRLESHTEEADVAAAEAQVRVAEAELARARRGLRPEERDAVDAELASAEARAALSTGIAERLERAARAGAATPDEIDRARRQAEADAHAAATAAARARAGRRGRREDVLVAEARVTAARAELDRAQAALADKRIVAPIAGEILEIRNRTGEYVMPSTTEPVIVMGDTRRIRARLDVDEADIGALALGARALVRADAYPGRDFSGRVVEIARRMGRKNARSDEPTERIDTKILEVVVELDDPSGLVIGLRVTGYVERAATS